MILNSHSQCLESKINPQNEKPILGSIILENKQAISYLADGSFAGYASVFNILDNVNDVILPGAFQKYTKIPGKIKLLWQHDTSKPIGIVQKLYEDDYGLYIEGKIFLDIIQGKEAYLLIKKGAVRHMSIGYQVKDFFYKDEIRYIRKVKLWEVSFVTFAANKSAEIIDIKQLQKNAEKLESAIVELNLWQYGGR